MKPFRNLNRRPRRTILTVAGVTLAIALSFTMFSISGGMEESVKQIFLNTGIDAFVVAEDGNFIFGIMPPIEGGVDAARLLEEGNPEVRKAVPMLSVGFGSTVRVYAANATVLDKALSGGNVSLAKDRSPFKYVVANGLIPGDWDETEFKGIQLVEGVDFQENGDPFYQDGTYAGGSASPLFTHEMLVNEATAVFLGVGAGERIYLGTTVPSGNSTAEILAWYGNATYFNVTAVTRASWESSEEHSVSLHLSELQYVTGLHGVVNQMLLDVKAGEDIEAVKARLERSRTAVPAEYHTGMNGDSVYLGHRYLVDVDGNGDFKDDVVVTVDGERRQVLLVNSATGRISFEGGATPDQNVTVSYVHKTFPVRAFTTNDFMTLVGDFMDTFRGISTIISLVTMAIAFFFTATVMSLAVRERTVEIGILRAIGISRRTIFWEILLESLAISLIGFALGIVLGYAMAHGMNWTMLYYAGDSVPPGVSFIYISWLLILEVSGLAILIGIASGFLPAIRAVNVNISKVIRSE